METNNLKITFAMVDYFKSTLSTNSASADSFTKITKLSLQRGYIIDPSACGKDTESFLENYLNLKQINTKSTFYKTWSEVLEKNGAEIFIDQYLHYASTYGSNFQSTPYIVNDDRDANDNIVWSEYIFIQSLSVSDYFEKCYNALNTSIALSTDLVKDICEYICEYANCVNSDEFEKITNSIRDIKNKEAKRILMARFNIKPNNGNELFAYIYTKITGEPMIIKNSQTMRLIKSKVGEMLVNSRDNVLNDITDDDMKLLATVFYRYKPLFLSMKVGYMSKKINKIRKYAKKYHVPMKKQFFDDIINNILRLDMADLKSQIDANNNISIFKLITVLSSLRNTVIRLNSENEVYNLYRIRNGKSYIKQLQPAKISNESMDKLQYTMRVIMDKLKDMMKTKRGVVRFPDNIVLTCPTSEKSFVGDIPMNSYINLKDNFNFIGIYWKNEWGTYDYDLSALLDDGSNISWRSDFYQTNDCDSDNNLIYSGDMTSANPDATEILYCRGKMFDFNIFVNRYNGDPGTQFNLFYGSKYIRNLRSNYRVNEQDILFKATFKPEQQSFMAGRVMDNKLYFTNLSAGNSRISRHAISPKASAIAIGNKIKSSINLRELLLCLGFEEYDPSKHDKIDYDLSTPNKETIIDIFA